MPAVNGEPMVRAEWRAVLGVALLSVVGTVLLRWAGLLWPLESRLLDLKVRWLQEGDARHVMLVLEHEADLQRHGYPLPDSVLERALSNMLDSGARVIAVDKFRDRPVAPGSEALDARLRASPQVIWVARFDGGSGQGVPPPAAARAEGRYGCADLVTDRDGVVRRALLAQASGTEACLSLPLVAVLQALGAQQREGGFSDSPQRLQLDRATIAPLAGGTSPYTDRELGGFQIELPHRTGKVPALALDRILQGPSPELKDKVVFLGTAAASLGDRHRIPVMTHPGPGHVAGVEVHARQAEDLLRLAAGELSPVRPPPGRLDGLLALLVAAGIAWAILRAPPWHLLWPAAGLLVGVAAGGLVWMEALGWRAELLPAIAAGVLSAAGAWARRVREEQQARAELCALFSRQVAPEVAEVLWRERAAFFRAGRIAPAEVEVTVLFADLRGFTTVTERLDPNAMVDWLNGAIDVMARSVMEQGGVVTRFGGDQIMAVWGVPVPRKDLAQVQADAERAVRAGLLIRDRLAELNLQPARSQYPAARVRIGIQSGRALQAGVGSSDRFEFTVLGDAVNIAARLESLAADDDGSAARILAGDRTVELCGHHFNHEPEGTFTLKGKAIPVTVHRILGDL